MTHPVWEANKLRIRVRCRKRQLRLIRREHESRPEATHPRANKQRKGHNEEQSQRSIPQNVLDPCPPGRCGHSGTSPSKAVTGPGAG